MFTLIIGVVFLILFLDLRSRIIRLEEKTGLQSPINRQQISGGGGQPVTALGGGGNLVPNPTMAGGFLATSLAEKQGASVGERFGAWLKEDWLAAELAHWRARLGDAGRVLRGSGWEAADGAPRGAERTARSRGSSALPRQAM